MDGPTIELLGTVSLSLFLAMALMSLRLWELVNLALPILIILAVQAALAVFLVIFLTFRIMGSNYDAAVICAGQCGFQLGATPTAIANMQAITSRYGISPMAFLLVPIIGAFLIDIFNAVIIQASPGPAGVRVLIMRTARPTLRRYLLWLLLAAVLPLLTRLRPSAGRGAAACGGLGAPHRDLRRRHLRAEPSAPARQRADGRGRRWQPEAHRVLQRRADLRAGFRLLVLGYAEHCGVREPPRRHRAGHRRPGAERQSGGRRGARPRQRHLLAQRRSMGTCELGTGCGRRGRRRRRCRRPGQLSPNHRAHLRTARREGRRRPRPQGDHRRGASAMHIAPSDCAWTGWIGR